MSKLLILLMAVTGVPLFAVMALSALITHQQADMNPESIIISFYQLAESPLLTSLPLFAFAGYLLAHSNAPRRLLRVSNALVGWMPAGLALVVVLASSLMTSITGASGITIVAIGGLLYPVLREKLYSEKFSLGLITLSGSMGILLPPSLPVILYGVVAKVSIEDLFIAGVVPTILMTAALFAYALRRGRQEHVAPLPFSWRELRAALREAIWEAPLPVIVVWGIFSGRFTVSEASVIAALYLLVVELAIYREIPLGKLGFIARESAILVGGILMILGMTLALSNYIIDAEIPQRLFEYAQAHMTSKYAFLIAVNLFLLLVGCLLDIFAATVLVVPLLAPIAAHYGVDPVHMGIIFITNLAIGYSTPPVGMNLFIASVRFQQPVLKLYWASLPPMLWLLGALVLITFFPELCSYPLEIWRGLKG